MILQATSRCGRLCLSLTLGDFRPYEKTATTDLHLFHRGTADRLSSWDPSGRPGRPDPADRRVPQLGARPANAIYVPFGGEQTDKHYEAVL